MGGQVAFTVRHGGRQGEGEHGGGDQVGAAAGLAALRLGLAGRKGEEEDEQDEEEGSRRGRQRHGGVRGEECARQ